MIRKNPLLVKYLSYTIALLFAFIYAPFEFIEGDDAQTMMFHLSNYNFQKYQPYSTYHLGFDLLVYVLNKLIGVMYLNQVVFSLNIVVVCLNLFFIDKIFFSRNKSFKMGLLLFPILLILVSPEWLFSSWVLGSPNFALLFSLIGLWIYFNWKKSVLVYSSLFFSLSIFFRFDFLYVYFFLYIYESIRSEVFFIGKAKLFWIIRLGLYIAFFTICIILVGYSVIHRTDSNYVGISSFFKDIINVFKLKLQWVEIAQNSDGGVKSAIGAIGFFTPLFVYTTCMGLYGQKDKPFFKLWLTWLSIIVCLSFPLGWYFTFSGTIKRMLFAVPFFILPTNYWIENLRLKSLDFLFALLLIAFQFCVGLNVDTAKTAYGPNLSMENFYKLLNNVKVKERFFLDINSGFAFPTEEGVRPVLGFGYSLLEWSKFYHIRNGAYENVLLNPSYYTVVDTRTAIFDYILFKNDYKKVYVEKILINNVIWQIEEFKNDQKQIKRIISIAGDSMIWRRDLNVKNILDLHKYLNCNLNFAFVYSSNWKNKFFDFKNIYIKTPYTGILIDSTLNIKL
jgi:hypothetical protein